MVKFHTTYKWKLGKFKAAAKAFVGLFDGSAPKVVQDAMTKFKNVQMFYAWSSGCFYAIYDIDEKDIPLTQVAAMFLADMFDLETNVIIDSNEHGKLWDQLDILGSEK